ncbi:MAG: hypothetical protein KC442_22800 [Thermomicrobiales bacterium]|nr:hypothetical protein [Thermomicrobiales bacterium]
MLHRAALLLAVMLVVIPARLASADEPHQWFLNANGTTNTYQIFAFNDDGTPQSVTPVASPEAPLVHLAWPSAIQVKNERWLLASGYDGSQWGSVHRWVSTDNGPWVAKGPWLTADASEPYGLGPAHVLIDPEAPEPFSVIYLVRGASGPGDTIAVATSADGVTWRRHGPILSKSLPQEAGGLTLGYACRDTAGQWVVWYSGYSTDLTRAAALVATGDSLLHPMVDKIVMMEGDNNSTGITANQAENTAIVGTTLKLGTPHLIIDGAHNELVVPVVQDDSRIWLDRPLLYQHTNATIVSMAARKVEPSYAQEQPDGSWKAIMTVYGPQPGIFAEYTTEASAPNLNGPWTFDASGIRFSPWLNSTRYSTENPTPLAHGPSCTS